MPQYMISVWHDDTFEVDFSSPDAQRSVAQVGAFNEELQKAGAWVFAAGLHPASSATVVRSSGGDVSMTDGPYAETKEQMGGFWMIDAVLSVDPSSTTTISSSAADNPCSSTLTSACSMYFSWLYVSTSAVISGFIWPFS